MAWWLFSGRGCLLEILCICCIVNKQSERLLFIVISICFEFTYRSNIIMHGEISLGRFIFVCFCLRSFSCNPIRIKCYSGDTQQFLIARPLCVSPFSTPRFAIPELVTRGDSWIFPVGNAASLLASHRRRAFWHRQQQQQKRHQNRPSRNAHIVAANSRMGHSLPERINFRLNDEQSSILRRFPSIPISPCSCCLNTPFGRVALKRLLPTDGAYLRPPDVEKGTIVAIYYELEACSSTHSNPCSSSAAYLNWLPSPTYEENRMVSGVACEMNVERGCSMPIVSPARAASQARPTQPPEDLNSNPLCFQFVFHIVINGIDLITISVSGLCAITSLPILIFN